MSKSTKAIEVRKAAEAEVEAELSEAVSEAADAVDKARDEASLQFAKVQAAALATEIQARRRYNKARQDLHEAIADRLAAKETD